MSSARETNLVAGRAGSLRPLHTRPEVIPPGASVRVEPLQRLLPADVEAMARASVPAGTALDPGLVARVSRRAEGVPLFVEELMRTPGRHGTGGRAPRPPSRRAFATCSPHGWIGLGGRADTAHLAAVLGREFATSC